ncbi:MAG: hypothetical protein KBD63_07690 [Bacteriovoracaceae bacterium]|nr:hypothetical protein [Bacteriovoracaceae bacterium]
MIAIFNILLCTVFRLLPHAPNFTPVGASAVFVGRQLPFPLAVLSLVATMLLSDFFLSQMFGYPLFTTMSFFVYGAFIFQCFLGKIWRETKGGSFLAAGIGAVAFFLITNCAVWFYSGMYEKTFAGLMLCYTAALPFFRNAFYADMLWTSIFILMYRYLPQLPLLKKLSLKDPYYNPQRFPVL